MASWFRVLSFLRVLLSTRGEIKSPTRTTHRDSHNTNRGHKLAKSLLKVDQSNVSLWNAFAHLEECHGKLDEVRFPS